MTKAEIIARAFTRTLTETRIQDDVVEACQTKYIKPLLGEDFYNAVILTPGDYTTLISTYLKPILAWWVRYMILPELRTELSDLGIVTVGIKDATPVDNETFAQVRDNTRIIAEQKEKLLTEYLEDNYSSYPLYYPRLNPNNRVEIVGGIVMKKCNKLWDFDDGPEFWND
jgi:hypothetical protein